MKQELYIIYTDNGPEVYEGLEDALEFFAFEEDAELYRVNSISKGTQVGWDFDSIPKKPMRSSGLNDNQILSFLGVNGAATVSQLLVRFPKATRKDVYNRMAKLRQLKKIISCPTSHGRYVKYRRIK